jgi:hypothetical protein
VPTLTFRLRYCFFVIDPGRRRILHFNVTEHPSAPWIVQPLREAFPNECGHYLISDRDTKFSEGVIEAIRTIGMKPIRTAYQSPWQNGVAERGVASCRRDLLGYVIVLNEAHRRRLGRDYLHYYHEDRTHNGAGQGDASGSTNGAQEERPKRCRLCATRRRAAPPIFVARGRLNQVSDRTLSRLEGSVAHLTSRARDCAVAN